METYFLLIVAILIILAASDLVVGVSNDAVNFLNSAVGSKAAPFKLIMLIAAAGILFGATFSSGMMEVARSGIFHPQEFFFSEIIILFLAVMMTDIILLDVFNTFALPTSTTVSIVFELLGAAVAMSLIKINNGTAANELAKYINTSSAIIIISGILLSVVIAFSIGALVQYLVRILFTFDYEKSIRYYGALWGGFAVCAITYFILIKGAKGSSFLTEETVAWIKSHTLQILGISFAGWTLIMLLAQHLLRLNILKIIVLIGTFALAMAFAGNDLVNFIGVPLAGLESFREYMASGSQNPGAFAMTALAEEVQTPTFFLLIAGTIMVLALWTSKKARSVTQTEINLGRQDEGYERFESSSFARGMVRAAIALYNVVSKATPQKVNHFLNHRLERSNVNETDNNHGASFDLVRASVNLVAASILISFATSLRLPLSTTYVTFMVAMGTSLADGAWGRESAVYRVTGVLTVIGGWFFTALCAFGLAFLLVYLIHWGALYAVMGLLVVMAFFLYKTFRLHRQREEKHRLKEAELTHQAVPGIEKQDPMQISREKLSRNLSSIAILYNSTLSSLITSDLKGIKRIKRSFKSMEKELEQHKYDTYQTIKQLPEDSLEVGLHYVQVLDFLSEIHYSLDRIAVPVSNHVRNHHPELKKDQKADISSFAEEMNAYLSGITQMIKTGDFDGLPQAEASNEMLVERINRLRHIQLKRIKKGASGTKSSNVFLNTMAESRNMVHYWYRIARAQYDLMSENHEKLALTES